MKTIKEIYQRSSYEIRMKAPILSGVIISFALFSLLLTVASIISGSGILHFILYFIAGAVIVGAYISLRRGNYELASNGLFIISTVVLVFLRFSEEYQGNLSLAYVAAIIGPYLVFASIFIRNRKILFGLLILYALAFGGMVIKGFLIGAQTEFGTPSLQGIVYPGVAVGAVFFGLMTTGRIFSQILNNTMIHLNEVKEYGEKVGVLVSESSRQMNKADSLLNDAKETSLTTEKMEEDILNIINRMKSLDALVDSSFNAIDQVKDGIEDLKNISDGQASYVTESGSSIEQMAVSIGRVSEVITLRKEATSTLAKTSENGGKAIGNTIKAFSQVTSLLGRIGEMTTIISDIAEQTNLLAMNAAIEAAHAGTAGKGFAVVAMEIRKLAENSGLSVRTIEETAQALVSSIENVDKDLKLSGESFQRISEDVREVSEGMEDIYRSTDELNTGVKEILNATKNLTDTTSALVDQINTVKTAQEVLQKDSLSMSNVSREITGDSDNMVNELSKVKQATERIFERSRDLMDQSRKLDESLKK
ncbi:MAG: methyl-accepting chemotaxis protein [Spirochaetales bacterium]|nr:methyl-accepting chemotaxis protein [Spirochaetales bacterium]